MSGREASEKSVFLQAIEIASAAEQAAYLDAACGTDTPLRAQVESLLQVHRKPPCLSNVAEAARRANADEPLSERPGTVIGPYKLLQQIGEGGMGTVFMAEQTQPVQRKVALKIIKAGMASKQVIARFEAERQALALMDHVNIARVLDAGATEAGRPYFVMELVHGIPITQYCDDNRLTPRERLELFVPVCQAIQHAHQKGVIHRDIKPSNVMITLYDGKPVPKVIDFGVAKAISQKLTEQTLFTQYGTMVGTLEYMSPEQAEMSALGADTRSDIFSLGVLLYELLTGSTPLSHKRLKEAAYGEILRMIKEEEAPRPSTRLSDSGAALASISAQRHTEPAQLTKLVRGELDWIVMKTLEKDRNRRYETAGSFAADVQRYLNDEPVQACPPSARYRLRKFARKHKKLLVTAAAFVTLLLLGVAASVWQAVRATQAEALALTHEQQADANAAEAQEKEREANQQRDTVRALNDQLQRTLYAAHMNLAQHAWEEASVARVLELLEQHRPKPGESDLRGFEWHYLNRLCHQEILTLQGHTTTVSSVAYSPDGKRLASASNEVKVWDAQTGQELLTLPVSVGNVWSVAFSPDGKRLASASGNPPDNKSSALKVWDAQTGQELLTLKGHSGMVNGVAFSPDSKRLASAGGQDPWVKVWDAQTGREILSLLHGSISGGGYRRCVAFSLDGKRLASAGRGVVQVWDAQTGQELLTIKGHTPGVHSVVFSPDGQRLASAGGGWVKVWDAHTGQELLTLEGGSGNVAFSPDGQRLASASENTVKIWDATPLPEKP